MNGDKLFLPNRLFRRAADSSWQPGEKVALLPTVLGSPAKKSLCRQQFSAAHRKLRFSANSSRQPIVNYGFLPKK
jgi:hypothetical protein